MSDFEERLTVWGTTEAAAAGPAPAFRGTPKRRWMPAAAAAAVLVVVGGVAAVLTGSGDDTAGPVASPSPTLTAEVPWTALAPGPEVAQQPSPTPSVTASDCRGSDLSLRFGGTGALTGEQILQQVVVETTRRCHLDADVTAMSGVVSGQRVSLPLDTTTYPASGVPGVIDPDHPGTTTLSFNLVCDGSSPPSPSRGVTSVHLTLLGSDLPVAPGGGGFAGHETPATLRFCSPVVGVNRAGASEATPTYLPLAMASLQVSLQAPQSVIVGADLDYVVTLTNPTGTDIELGPCPSYIETVRKAKELYRLNCEQAHPVPAHGTETFAIRLHITQDVTAGTERLTWALDLVLGEGKQPIGSTDVMIVDPTDPAAGHEGCVFAAANVRPCARGMLIGRTYPYLLRTHCGLNDAYADGRWWTAVHPLPESDAPDRYDRDDDAGTVSLIASDQLEYVTSKGVRVAMEPLQGILRGCD